ncbi:hypothetical protein M514_07996 [Trichuris suis]|uniref:Uncharacterized protein n=1 Tax=Trichuris suis TaxID=68888 RepID=A0A085M1K0_9BILA|nr:hypothetical protein M513_07996 [Trichuris suis]KFD63065.1 hypothetical protein M514_07996 [Trichuris suis]
MTNLREANPPFFVQFSSPSSHTTYSDLYLRDCDLKSILLPSKLESSFYRFAKIFDLKCPVEKPRDFIDQLDQSPDYSNLLLKSDFQVAALPAVAFHMCICSRSSSLPSHVSATSLVFAYSTVLGTEKANEHVPYSYRYLELIC